MLKFFSKLLFLVILLLHHGYAVPVHSQDEKEAAQALIQMYSTGTGHRVPHHQPHHPAPQQHQVAQPSTHSVHRPRSVRRPFTQVKKHKCQWSGCEEAYAKSEGLEGHVNAVHLQILRRLCLNFCQLMTKYCTAYICHCKDGFANQTGLKLHMSLTHSRRKE